MQNYDIIDRLPCELANCLLTDSFFQLIPVVVAEKGNLSKSIEESQAVINAKSGKRGVAVIVLQVIADDVSNDLQFGPMLLRPAFQVIENVELNHDDQGIKKSARQVARRIRDAIKNQNMTGLIGNMQTGKPCIEPAELKDADGKSISENLVSYQVNFECMELGLVQMTAVQIPSILAAAPTQTLPAQCALASGTPGAAIWYTTDDSFPFNGDKTVYPQSTATLYTGPVNIPQGGCWLRARAYVDGETYIASGVQRIWLAN
jgi:hypothetical protein